MCRVHSAWTQHPALCSWHTVAIHMESDMRLDLTSHTLRISAGVSVEVKQERS